MWDEGRVRRQRGGRRKGKGSGKIFRAKQLINNTSSRPVAKGFCFVRTGLFNSHMEVVGVSTV